MLALLLLAVLPHSDIVRESCALVELSHFYDENGRLVFDQVIFYENDPEDAAKYRVLEWRLVKGEAILPQRDWRNGGYVQLWLDGDKWREMRAVNYRETWLQYDVELLERDIFPKEKRRGLRMK